MTGASSFRRAALIVLTFAGVAGSRPSVPPARLFTTLPSPVAHWKLDDGSGSTAADATGNGHTGTLLNGPAWTPSGILDGALGFDGTNDQVQIPYDAALAPQQLTLA